jgi:hypothetical protein
MIPSMLTEKEMDVARRVGLRRLRDAKGQPHWAYDGRSGTDTHIVGAQAELAFCRALNLTWSASVNTYNVADVAPFWQVRHSNRLDVKVAVRDNPEWGVVAVRGRPPRFEIVGYVLAGGVQARYPLQDPGQRHAPAHFVPYSRLTPINPGFHAVHQWMQYRGRWICFVCEQKP